MLMRETIAIRGLLGMKLGLIMMAGWVPAHSRTVHDIFPLVIQVYLVVGEGESDFEAEPMIFMASLRSAFDDRGAIDGVLVLIRAITLIIFIIILVTPRDGAVVTRGAPLLNCNIILLAIQMVMMMSILIISHHVTRVAMRLWRLCLLIRGLLLRMHKWDNF